VDIIYVESKQQSCEAMATYDSNVMVSCLGYLQMPLPSATRSNRSTARSTMVCASMTM
jgi:hypothetical protein